MTDVSPEAPCFLSLPADEQRLLLDEGIARCAFNAPRLGAIARTRVCFAPGCDLDVQGVLGRQVCDSAPAEQVAAYQAATAQVPPISCVRFLA